MWIIFYKNSVSLNVYSRLKFFTWCFKSFYLILTYSNFSKFALGMSFGQSRLGQSRWGQNGWSIVVFTCYMITMKILGIRRDRWFFECTKGTCLVYISFLFSFYHNVVWWFVYDWSSAIIVPNAYEGCITYREFDSHFRNNYQDWF